MSKLLRTLRWSVPAFCTTARRQDGICGAAARMRPLGVGRRALSLAVLALVSACAAVPELPPVPSYGADMLAGLETKAVLIAGDDSLVVFDNATAGLRRRLMDRGVAVSDIQSLTASKAGGPRVSLSAVTDAVAAMRPSVGQACLVFATSHGGQGLGLLLSPGREFLTPQGLDRALAVGCGNAPTVVVVSGCFSGSFAKAPMNRANRVILTAAREDRTSFGCGAGREFTVYDKCLLDAIDALGGRGKLATWAAISDRTRGCVAAEERRVRVVPSEPQSAFGAAVPGMGLPALR